MRCKFLFFLLFPLVVLPAPINTLWKLDLSARGGSSNGKELLLWGNGVVYKIDRKGKIIWKRFFKNLERAFLLPDGQALVITKQGNRSKLALLNQKGIQFWQFSIEKVKSIAARGKKIAVIANDSVLYILTLRDSPSRLRGWRRYDFHKRINGVSILIDGRISLIMPDSLCIFQEGKQPLFYLFPDIKTVSPLTDGGFVSLTAHSDQLLLSRHIASGYVLWNKEFKGNACSFISSFPFFCLAVEEKVGGNMKERKLFILNQRGDVVWKRGGLLLKPIPLLLTPRGELLCRSAEGNKLLLFNHKGRFIWEKNCGGKIMGSLTLDPATVLLFYGDKVELVEVRLNER